MTFKCKIIVSVYLVITLVIIFGGYVFYGFKSRENYYSGQQNLQAEMKLAFNIGDYSRCVSAMENSIRLKQEKTTQHRDRFTSVVDRRPSNSGISYFYTTLYPAWDNIENHLSCDVNVFLQEFAGGGSTYKKSYQYYQWMQLGKSMAKSEILHIKLLGLWLTRDDAEMARVLFSGINRGEVGFVCHMTITIVSELEGVSAEDKFNYYVKALARDYPKLKKNQGRMMILEQMQGAKCHAVFLESNAIKSGMSKIGTSEKIVVAMNQCWGKDYPEDTRYLIRHLDSYISGPENLEPQIDAWLKANPN
jgi:hypothetical protein